MTKQMLKVIDTPLPELIDSNTLLQWTNGGKDQVDVIKMIAGNPTSIENEIPIGKFIPIPSVGRTENFSPGEWMMMETHLGVRTFDGGVDWFILTDNKSTWEFVEDWAVYPFKKLSDLTEDEQGRKLKVGKFKTLLSAVVFPYIAESSDPCVEDCVQMPILGTRTSGAYDGGAPSDFVDEGEIVIPLLPVDYEEWKVERQGKGDFLSDMTDSDFIYCVCEHQKACNRFAHALWAVNFTKG